MSYRAAPTLRHNVCCEAGDLGLLESASCWSSPPPLVDLSRRASSCPAAAQPVAVTLTGTTLSVSALYLPPRRDLDRRPALPAATLTRCAWPSAGGDRSILCSPPLSLPPTVCMWGCVGCGCSVTAVRRCRCRLVRRPWRTSGTVSGVRGWGMRVGVGVRGGDEGANL